MLWLSESTGRKASLRDGMYIFACDSLIGHMDICFPGYIDLSKRRVYMKDLIQCEERFAKAKAINSILRHVGDQLGYTEDYQLEDLYDRAAWFFDRKYRKKAAAYDIYKKAIA